MRCIFKNGNDIQNILHLNSKDVNSINTICKKYPMLVNEYYLSLIDLNDDHDPIRKMCIPSLWELSDDGHTDTSGEKRNTVMRGVQHKYKQTLLVLSTNECFMYCRHCFRKRMVGITNTEISFRLKQMVDYIKKNPTINNVLISGGDAFCNSNTIIKQYLEQLVGLEQIEFIRFGTRAPVVFPQRIFKDNELLEILKEYNEKKQIYIVTQFNHPRELTFEAICAIHNLKKIGIIIKNQAVLLKGVNDSSETISQLLSGLTSIGVIPYYIFQCRPVRGVVNHFQVPLKQGCKIIDGAKSLQNGQGKCIRYILSHDTGKIEILGENQNEEMIFKYHQSKEEKNENRIFTQKIDYNQCWL